jgi:hypothetical protein
MSQNTINVAHTTHNNITPLHQQNNTTRVSISNLVNSQNLSPHNVVNIYSNYQNSSNLPPLEQPRILDDLPEINLDLIENHVHHRLSQIGFENPAGAVFNDEPGIDLNQTGQIAQDNFAGQNPRRNFIRPIAWGWREPPGFRPYTLRRERCCQICHAILFQGERNSLCCRSGSINIHQPPPPPDLLQMFKDAT